MGWREVNGAFGYKSHLNTHINLVHLKLREHACPYCPGIAYQTKSDLKTHVNLVHLKLREHACPYCPGVAYQTNSSLKPEDAHQSRLERAINPQRPARSFAFVHGQS